MKFLVVLVVVVVVLWLLLGRSRRGGDAGKRGPADKPAAAEGMLRCAHCGVHLPASEALQIGERAYCSAAHRDAGPRAP